MGPGTGAAAAVEVEAATARVLLVDDDPYVRRAYRRVLQRAGFEVSTAADGEEALAALATGAFDALVSDIDMPRMNGLELLAAVRRQSVAIPVLLVTGGPRLETAIAAIDHGAVRYLPKPVAPDALCDAVRRAVTGGRAVAVDAQEDLDARFTAALTALRTDFQPIVSWSRHAVAGYEALLRTTEPSLASPAAFLLAAERLGRVEEVGRAVRAYVAAAAAGLAVGVDLFVNLHPQDLADEELYDPAAPLSRHAPRVVLELTERASLESIEAPRSCVDGLRRLGYRLAVDDLGAGYASLSSLAQLEPEVVKLDMSLARHVEASPKTQLVVRAVVDLGRVLGVRVVTEGVESAAERDALLGLGCDLLQGYHFGRPGPGFAEPRW